jgi:uncharacterized repeat protein (TIGR01451 family)
VGDEFSYEISAKASEGVANVIISDRVPEGAKYVRSEPTANVEGPNLIWRLENMEPNETKTIKVWVQAEREGTLGSCATVSAQPRTCATVVIGKPALAIEKTGPALVPLGDPVSYNIVVRNTGSSVARGVVVTDTVPEGLQHESGQSELSFNVGDLGPGQSKAIPVTFKAAKRGRVCNTVLAKASNGASARAEACTTIGVVLVKLEKTGDKRQFIGRSASYKITVSNEGDIDLPELTVVDTAPPETTILAAPGASLSGNVATWRLGAMPRGEPKTLEMTLTARSAGNLCNNAIVTGWRGSTLAKAEACTEWIGVTGVLVEVVDDPDPIQVGETSTYTLRVTNQGTTQSIEQMNISAQFPDEMDPVTASGGASINGKTVTWPVTATIAPKQSVSFTLVGKGLKAGDSRLKVDVTTRLRQNPITKMESTTVY